MVKKWIILLMTGLVMLVCSPLTASAAYAEVRIMDEGSLLSQGELEDCTNRLKKAADKTGMNIGVILGTQSRSEYTIESLADSTYDQVFGKNTDGLLYYIDLSRSNSAYDYISTSGMGQFYYTNARNNDRIASIFSVLDAYLKPAGSEDIWGALMQFADEVEYFYEEGVPDRYYYYDDVYNRYYYLDHSGNIQSSVRKPYVDWAGVILTTFAAFMTGLVTAVVLFFVTRFRYQFKYSLTPTTYVNKKKVQYNQQFDNFVRESTSRVVINSGGSGGSHSGGGGGHSHGGHGGGGHHR